MFRFVDGTSPFDQPPPCPRRFKSRYGPPSYPDILPDRLNSAFSSLYLTKVDTLYDCPTLSATTKPKFHSTMREATAMLVCDSKQAVDRELKKMADANDQIHIA